MNRFRANRFQWTLLPIFIFLACSCAIKDTCVDFSTPRKALQSLFNADYERQAERLINCFTDDYFASFGFTREIMLTRLQANFDKQKSRLRFDQIEILNETQSSDKVRLEYKVTDKSKENLVLGEKLAYLFSKTPAGWKVYGADTFDGKHWRFTEEADPFKMRSLEEILQPHHHEDPTSPKTVPVTKQ